MGQWLRDNGDWFWPVLGIVVAVVGAFAAVWANRTYGNRRLKIVIDVQRSPIVKDTANGLITVSVQGDQVEHPVIVSVDVYNNGPGDVSSERFDRGQPIVIDVEPMRTVALASSSIPEVALDVHGILIGPALLKRGERVSVQVICDGMQGGADASFQAPLIDVDAESGVDALRGAGRWYTVSTLLTMAPLVLMVTMLVSLYLVIEVASLIDP